MPAVQPNAVVKVGSVEFGNAKKLAIIAGPCALESRAHALDKANRTSGNAERGIGLELAAPIFAEIRERLGIPVLTDVHERDQMAAVAEAVDVLQIPAFLSRQTDLLVAAARTSSR